MKYLKIILATTIIAATLSGCNTSQKPDKINISPTPIQIYQIGQSQIRDREITLSGQYLPNKTIDILASSNGKISTKNKKYGDKVEKGEIISTLDAEIGTNIAKISLSQARTNLYQTISLQNTTRKSLDLAIQQAKDNIAQAKASLNIAQKNKKRTQNNKGKGTSQISIQQAKETLTNAKITNQIAVDASHSTMISTWEKYIDDGYEILQNIDTILGIEPENKYANDKIESYIGSLDISAKTKLEEKYKTTKQIWNTINTNNADIFFDKMKKISELQTQMEYILSKSTTGSSFTSDNLATYQATNKADISSWNTARINAKTLKDNYDSAISAQRTAIDTYTRTLQTTKLSSAGAIDTANNNQTQAELALKSAQTNLTNAIRKREIELKNLDIQITSLKTQVKTGKIAVGDLFITAPFTGVITAEYADIGQEVKTGSKLYSLSSADSSIVRFDISKNERTSIDLSSKIIFYDNTGRFSGEAKISKISPILTGYKYAVEANVQTSTIALGDFVDVKIYKNFPTQPAGYYYLPLSSVVRDFDDSFVWTINTKQQITKSKIKIWEIWEDTALVSGQLDNQQILVKKPQTLKEKDIIQKNKIEILKKY